MKKRQKKRKPLLLRVATLLCVLVAASAVLALIGGGAIYIYAKRNIDPQMDEALFAAAGSDTVTRLYYNGEEESGASESEFFQGYYPVELEKEALAGAELCERVDAEEIPDFLKNAFVAIEDRRFYEHDGVDWLRTAKAAMNYVFRFDSRFGGSSITQQLIKNIGGENEISAARKLKEILRALRLEREHSKEEILEAYLNVIPLGHGCVGVGAASRIYFGKSVSELTVAQGALLAAVTNSPARYDPIAYPKQALERRNLVLDQMCVQGYLSSEEALLAKSEALGASITEDARGNVVSWYTETVIDDVVRALQEQYGYTSQAARGLVWGGGLTVYTLMDPTVQEVLNEYFRDASHLPKEVKDGLNYGFAVTDPKTGNLLGVIGGVGEKKGNRLLNLATQTRRAPGSTLKPLAIYGPAIEEGMITSATVFDDVPVSFGADPRHPVPWPRNSPNVYQGLLNVADAVAYSKNTVAVQLYRKLGAEKIYRYLVHRLGFEGIVRTGVGVDGGEVTDLAAAPLALGQLSSGATVREMAAGYGAVASGGVYRKGRSFLLVLDGQGNVLLRNEPEETRVFSQESANLLTQLLVGVTDHGTAKALRLKQYVDVAGKTGTSGESRDKWFVGYTPYYCAAVWCGYAEEARPIGKLSKDHLKIWDEVMLLLHEAAFRDGRKEEERFSVEGLTRCRVCKDSGCLASEACTHDPRGDRFVTLWFKKGTEPKSHCARHVAVPYDFNVGGVITDGAFYEDEEPTYTALIDIPWRDFPMQIYIKDAEYVYRPLKGAEPGMWWGVPYFVNTVPKGRFVGITDHGGGRQFNCTAYERFLEKETEERIEENSEGATEKTEESTVISEGETWDNE